MRISFFLAFLTALISTLGSLYFSEILVFIPCKLCWFQRILMYPLVLILFFQTTRKDYRIQPAIIFSIIGVLLSSYHYMLQVEWIGSLETACSTISCGIKYINYFGFVTIPFLSFIGFSLISVFLVFSKKKAPRKIFSKR